MSVTLQIRFTGLCAIIPEKDINDPSNEATVVLVNARDSKHGPHHGLLFFDPACYIETPKKAKSKAQSNVEPGGNEETVIKEPEENRVALGIFNFDDKSRQGFSLEGEELIVLGRGAEKEPLPLSRNSLKFNVGLRPYPPQPCPTDEDEEDFTWVARNPGVINPAVLTASDLGYLIAARIRLTAGSFSADGFRSSDQGRIRWWFDGPESTVLAEQVVFEHEFDESVVGITIVSAPLRGYQPQLPLHLKPNPNDGFIRVWIVNMPLLNLLQLEQPVRSFDPDHHYEEYYNLCSWTPSLIIPQPDLASFCSKVTAASNPKCPPTYFSPLSFQSAFAAASSIQAASSISAGPQASENHASHSASPSDVTTKCDSCTPRSGEAK